MDQPMEEDEKEGTLIHHADVLAIGSRNEHDEIGSAAEPFVDGSQKDEDLYFRGNRKRPAESQLVAPKPKIKKKLHAVISQLKSSKETISDLFASPAGPTVDVGESSYLSSPNSASLCPPADNIVPIDGSNVTESGNGAPVDPSHHPSQLDEYTGSVVSSDSKRYPTDGVSSESSNFDNIYRPQVVSDSCTASASPKVKCKYVPDLPQKRPTSRNRSSPSIESYDRANSPPAKRSRFSPEQPPPEVVVANVASSHDDNVESNSPPALVAPIHPTESSPRHSNLDTIYGQNKGDKLDSIPVAKVDPLMEMSALCEQQVLPKHASYSDPEERDSKSSDSDHEPPKNSDNETKNSDNEEKNSDNDNSDCDDLNKGSLMGGSTGLSARPKVKNMRKNIRDILADDHLEEDTLAAQKEEQQRLQRLQEKRAAMREYLEQQQVERMVAEVAEAAEAVTAAEAVQEVEEAEDDSSSSQAELFREPESLQDVKKEPLEEDDDDDVVVLSSEGSDSEDKDSEPDDDIIGDSKARVLLQPKLEIKSEKDSDSSESEESESDSDSDVVVLSHSEDDDELEDDGNNCGSHVNDDSNAADVNGRVLVNVGHPDKEEDIFLAPQLAAAIKPHQIGGLRFLYDNIVESLEQFKTSNGFGCILAHSMGLGKTLQVISLTDVFLRHTGSKSVLIIVPINTLQNWLAEYNQWLPEEVPAGVPEGTEFRARNFKLFLSNDGQKSMKTRAKIIDDWHQQGGVLLMGYEMYRQLSLKKPKKPKKKKRKNVDEIVDIEEEDSNKEYLDEIYKALVRPGPDLIICDEGHRIKNAHANISQALKSIRTRRRVVLTGYPLQNNLLEYWCMVDFVRPNYLGNKTEFSNMFERPIQNGQCVDSTPQDVKLMRYRAHVLHALLEGFVQRRGHSVLANTLPQKHEHVILCRLTPIQRKLYNAYMAELTINKGMANPLKAFAICCKIWNHPDILYNLVMKRLNQDHDLDLDEVVGKPGAKSKRPPAAKAVDKRKGATRQQMPPKLLPPTEPPRGVATSGASSSVAPKPSTSEPAAPLNMPGFQPSGMGPPQMMPQHQNTTQQQQQQRPPMGATTSEHSNVNMGYGYPNMYGMQPQSSYMNQMPYPWAYNQAYPPDTNAQYMTPYNMYSPQYPHAMQQNQPGMPPYSMPPPTGHMGSMTPCGQNLPTDQRNVNNLSDNHQRQQNGGCMSDPQQQLESMDTNSHPEDRGTGKESAHMMPMTHNAHMDQNMGMGMAMGMQQDSNCKFNYMSPSPKISDQMNNLALEQKDFGGANRLGGLDDAKPSPSQLLQAQNMHGNFATTKDAGGVMNFESGQSQESNGKPDLEEDPKKEEFRKEEKIREEVSLEWAESYFKDYVPGLLETSTKFQLFFHILEGSLTVGDRVLVFSQSLFTLSQLEEFLQKSVIPAGPTPMTGDGEKWVKNRTYYRLDGSTASMERAQLINDFNNNPTVRVFLVSTRAGSLGINLVGANRVVVFDASFNPCHDTQAVCRVYRYGQQKDCHIYRMVTDNSLERRIYDRQVNKQGISDRIVDEMNPEAHLSSKEISNLLVEKEEEPISEDFSDLADDLLDPIFKTIVTDHSHLVTRAPFKHESLLVDRKDKKLSNAEKRLAKRSYEMEKQANISYSRPTYSSFYPKTAGAAAMGTKIGGVMYAKPVGTVRPMQVDARNRVDGGMITHPNILSRSSTTPVESLAKQGVSVQQITVPKDVSIPTNSGDGKPIQLKGGQSVMVIKTQKGMYLRLSDGKIVAIRIPPGNEDAFGLPLSQGSVTIVPTVFPARGRNVAGRGGSSIRRGRPPLSAQYALGNVVPKGVNKNQMAVRIIRKPIGGAARGGGGGGKPIFRTIAGGTGGQSAGTLLNKSVVITAAKPGAKKPAVSNKDPKMSPKVQITPVPPKPGGLASIGGTSGLNRRLNRNNKLFFQQATGGKLEEGLIDKPAAMFAMESSVDAAGRKRTMTPAENQSSPASSSGDDGGGSPAVAVAALSGERSPAVTDNATDLSRAAVDSGADKPATPAEAAVLTPLAAIVEAPPAKIVDQPPMAVDMPAKSVDPTPMPPSAVEENKSGFAAVASKEQISPADMNLLGDIGGCSAAAVATEKSIYSPMSATTAGTDTSVVNQQSLSGNHQLLSGSSSITKPEPLPAVSMLNPLSQLSNLLPPDDKEARTAHTSTPIAVAGFNAMTAQPAAHNYSQQQPAAAAIGYSNHQLFQPYLQRAAPSISQPGGGQPAAHMSMPATSGSEAAAKVWASRHHSGNNEMKSQQQQQQSAYQPQPPPISSAVSHYQNVATLSSGGSETPIINKLPPTPTSYLSSTTDGSQHAQSAVGGGQQSTDTAKRESTIGQMMSGSGPSGSALPTNSPLSLSNLLPEPLPPSVVVGGGAPLDYMNYSSAFRRVDYPPAASTANDAQQQAATTADMVGRAGVVGAPPYSTTVAAPSPGGVGAFTSAGNPSPYSQYQSAYAHQHPGFRASPMNPSGYPYPNQFSPYDHYGPPLGGPQGPPQAAVPLQQQPLQYPGQESYSYGSGGLPPYASGLSNFGQGPYPPM